MMLGQEPSHDAPRDSGGGRGSPAVERTRFAFLAEVARCLADSLDLETTLHTIAGLTLPHFGGWCLVDVLDDRDVIHRVAVAHPDAVAQRRIREFYDAHPPRADDPIGAARVIHTHHSEFLPVGGLEVLAEVRDEAHRQLLQELGARAFLIVPMRARGRTLGAITFVSQGRSAFADADLMLAEDLGRRCAMAIDNARLYRIAEDARRGAESSREDATGTAHRANALREVAEAAKLEAEAATRSKVALIATLSHEFRTPLGAVLGFVGLLNDGLAGPLTPLQRDYLRRIGNAAGGLLRLIEEVLTLSAVGAGRGVPLVGETDLAALAREVADLFHPVVAAKRLELRIDVPPALVVQTDGPKVRQIAINLLGNAIKFTAAGEVRLSLAENDGGVLLEVRDTGEGIAPADVERLFAAYEQGEARGTQPRGTGLGLAISRQLARMLGGDVTVRSAVGRGSTFTLRIPAVAAARVAPGAAEAESSERRVKARGDA